MLNALRLHHMRLFRTIFLALIAAVPLCRASFWNNFLAHEVSVITDTEMTAAGKALPVATPENPTYYIAVSLGYHDLGPSAGDRIPPADLILKQITKVLAQQGYLPATMKHKATISLVYTWGTLYPDKIEDPENLGIYHQNNRTTMLKFLGADKVGLHTPDPLIPEIMPQGLQFYNADARALADAATDDLYVAIIAAFDLQELSKKNKVLLWKTKISCPSRGLSLTDTLPTMITIAGPSIGKETIKPVWIDAGDKYKGEVKVGNPVFENFLDSGKLPVFQLDKAKDSKVPLMLAPPAKK